MDETARIITEDSAPYTTTTGLALTVTMPQTLVADADDS